MDGAGVGSALVVPCRPHCHVGRPVAVQIAQQRHGSAESVAGGKLRAVGRRGIYLGCALYGAVRFEEQHVDGSGVAGVRAFFAGPHGQVHRPVAVEIAQGRRRRSEPVAVFKLRSVGRRVVDLGRPFHGAVRVHVHYVDGAGVRRGAVVLVGPHCQIRHPVAVQIADGCDRCAEKVVRCKLRPVGRR